MKIMISACLLGIACRYDGQSKTNETLRALAEDHTLIPICPEQLGGLSTPRAASEITGDRVISKAGEDVTQAFQRGAEATLAIAQLTQADLVILKEGSPSCGVVRIYDGTFSKVSIPGMGKAAALLAAHGFTVFSEETFSSAQFVESVR